MLQKFLRIFILYALPTAVVGWLVGYVILNSPSMDKVAEQMRVQSDPVVEKEMGIPAGD